MSLYLLYIFIYLSIYLPTYLSIYLLYQSMVYGNEARSDPWALGHFPKAQWPKGKVMQLALHVVTLKEAGYIFLQMEENGGWEVDGYIKHGALRSGNVLIARKLDVMCAWPMMLGGRVNTLFWFVWGPWNMLLTSNVGTQNLPDQMGTPELGTIPGGVYPLVNVYIAIENGPVFIVDLPILIACWIFPVRFLFMFTRPGNICWFIYEP